MGRRALRKIDPSLDLSAWLRTVEQLPQPFSALDLFGREAPLEFEVGSGKGLFLRTAAARFPASNFLGVEVAGKYARFAAASLARRQLSNAVVVHGDALRVIHELLPDASLQAVHVYFPDPWWKKRHKKRRVMRPSFLADVLRTLQPGGALHFWTDVEEYFQTALELIATSSPLVGPIDVPEQSAEDDMDYRTHFERRSRLDGLSVYRAEFRKPSA